MRLAKAVAPAFFLALLLAFCPSTATAQQDIKTRIKKIKLNEAYLYGESRNADKDLAYESAMHDLLLSMNAWLQGQGREPLAECDVTPRANSLTYRRDEDIHVVCVFVKKEDVKQWKTGSESGKTSALDALLPAKPNAEASKPEASAGEATPATPATPVLSVIQPAKVEEEAPETPVLSVVQPAKVEAQAPATPVVAVQQPAKVENVQQNASTLRPVEENILMREMLDDVLRYLKSQKEAKRIATYEFARSLADIPAGAYILLFDKTRAVVALLSPVQNGKRRNVRTGDADMPDGYHGCGILWFK